MFRYRGYTFSCIGRLFYENLLRILKETDFGHFPVFLLQCKSNFTLATYDKKNLCDLVLGGDLRSGIAVLQRAISFRHYKLLSCFECGRGHWVRGIAALLLHRYCPSWVHR